MTNASAPPLPALLQIVGPPAVGKMAVGHEIALRTGLRLFHNHVSIEPVPRYFDFGSPQFSRLVGEFRRRLIEEVAASDLPGLIFTYVCAFDDPRDQQVGATCGRSTASIGSTRQESTGGGVTTTTCASTTPTDRRTR